MSSGGWTKLRIEKYRQKRSYIGGTPSRTNSQSMSVRRPEATSSTQFSTVKSPCPIQVSYLPPMSSMREARFAPSTVLAFLSQVAADVRRARYGPSLDTADVLSANLPRWRPRNPTCPPTSSCETLTDTGSPPPLH